MVTEIISIPISKEYRFLGISLDHSKLSDGRHFETRILIIWLNPQNVILLTGMAISIPTVFTYYPIPMFFNFPRVCFTKYPYICFLNVISKSRFNCIKTMPDTVLIRCYSYYDAMFTRIPVFNPPCHVNANPICEIKTFMFISTRLNTITHS